MKKSISYYVVLLVLKLKGVKRTFSQAPIDFKKVRKEDVRTPKGKWFAPNQLKQFKVSKTQVSEIKTPKSSQRLLLFIHGGAFVSGPTQLHWDTIKTIAKQTNLTIWLGDYPKAPEHKIDEISRNIDELYQRALEGYSASEIMMIGDSVGATLIVALTQRLLQKGENPPSKLFLISPVMDATLSNPEIAEIDKIDPMLSRAGILSAKEMCAGKESLEDVKISPIHGSFEGFPETIFFAAENDIAYPDQQLTIQKLKKAKINVAVIIGKEMPHIWPLLPVMKEAEIALQEIISKLK